MFPQLRRYQFVILCGLLACPTSVAISSTPLLSAPSHPLSYTEAWITISDRIEVKLRLFTDDIIRYDTASSQLPESIHADEFNQILDRQGQTLLNRMKIEIAGQRLNGKVTSTPEPWQGADVIHVAGSSNIKHAWSFEFPIPDSTVRSLTLRHSFSSPDLNQPGELRLHSRHKPWKQRIDAVIPPDLSYTVVFQQGGNSKGATATANETTSRIIVSPFAITHEFSLPLAGVLNAFQMDTLAKEKPSVEPTGSREQKILTINQQTQLGQQLNQWIQQNTIVMSKDNVLATQQSSVHFFEYGLIPEQPIPNPVPAPVATSGTLVGIRQTYAHPSTLDQGSVLLKSTLPGISEIRCETIVDRNANTSVQRVDDFQPNPVSENGDFRDGKVLHRWSTPTGELQSSTSLSSTALVSQKLVQQNHSSNGFTAWVMIGVGLGLTLLSIMHLNRHKLQASTKNQTLPKAIMTIGFIVFAVGFFRLPVRSYEASPTTINQWMTVALDTIYQSMQAPSEQQTVDRLSHWLSDDLVESTYLTLCAQITATPEQATWTEIHSVHLDSATAAAIKHPKFLNVSCDWEIKGTAYHWGHSHHVIRRYSGLFELANRSAGWKIAEITQLEAKPPVQSSASRQP